MYKVGSMSRLLSYKLKINMYNNYNRKSPIKNWLLFGFIMWTIWLGFLWFANQGEIVIIHHKYIEAQFQVDSIKKTQSNYQGEIHELEREIDRLKGTIDNKNQDVAYWSKLYTREKSKNDTTIKNTTNE